MAVEAYLNLPELSKGCRCSYNYNTPLPLARDRGRYNFSSTLEAMHISTITVASFFLAAVVVSLPTRMSNTQRRCVHTYTYEQGRLEVSCSLCVDASDDVMDTNCFKLKREDIEI